MKILRIEAVSEKTGLPPSSIYALITKGAFPKQVPLSANTVGWLDAEVDDWIAERAAGRNK